MSESKYLVNEFGSIVSRNLRIHSNQYQNHIKKFFDKNSEILLDTGISKRLVFSDTVDKPIFAKVTGVSDDQLKLVLRKHNLIDPSWKKWNRQTWVFQSILSIREYSKNKKRKELELAVLFLACGLYSSLHSKYFRNYLPNDNIMDYTINNLSNKFYIKKYGNLLKALQVTAMTSHNTYEDLIVIGNDSDLLEYVSQLNSRINAFVKAIKNEYEQNRVNKNYINKIPEGREEENYHEVDNASFQIGTVSQSVSLNLLSNKVRNKEVEIAAKMTSVSAKVLKQAIEVINEKKNKEITEFVTLILQLFIIDNKNEVKHIGTYKFIKETLELYTKSNINNPRVLRIKEILDVWLQESSTKYVQTERLATRSAFRKALFQYFIFSIQSVYLKR